MPGAAKVVCRCATSAVCASRAAAFTWAPRPGCGPQQPQFGSWLPLVRRKDGRPPAGRAGRGGGRAAAALDGVVLGMDRGQLSTGENPQGMHHGKPLIHIQVCSRARGRRHRRHAVRHQCCEERAGVRPHTCWPHQADTAHKGRSSDKTYRQLLSCVLSLLEGGLWFQCSPTAAASPLQRLNHWGHAPCAAPRHRPLGLSDDRCVEACWSIIDPALCRCKLLLQGWVTGRCPTMIYGGGGGLVSAAADVGSCVGTCHVSVAWRVLMLPSEH